MEFINEKSNSHCFNVMNMIVELISAKDFCYMLNSSGHKAIIKFYFLAALTREEEKI